MRKALIVAAQEYRHRVFQRSFLLGTLVLPFIFVVLIGLVIFVMETRGSKLPFGYVDHSGLLSESIQPPKGTVPFVSFSDEEQAMAALLNEEIQAYHVIPQDYLTRLEVDLFYLEDEPNNNILSDFDEFVRMNLVGHPTPLQNRIAEGVTLTVRSADGSREIPGSMGFITILFPLILSFFVFFVVMSTSGYFLQSITDEKENRTIEIMATTLSPEQIIGGKTIGLFGVGLTQLSLWILTIFVAWVVAQNVFPELSVVVLPWQVLLITGAFFLPTFLLVAGLMTILGISVTELQEAQQAASIVNLLFTFPMFFLVLIIANPNSPFLVFFSYFPTTAMMLITMRWGFTLVPAWEIALSWFILFGTAVGSIWLAVRVFRLEMLRYGQRFNFRTIARAIRRNG